MPRALRNQIGELLLAGFNGPSIPVELRAISREFSLGGIVLFARNVETPEQVADAARQGRTLATDVPAWVAVDQEGGRVARLKTPFTVWPPAATLGRSGDVALARRFAAALATELSAVGITLDFAPVLDVRTNPRNTVIGDRALADTAAGAARLGAVIVETLQAHGVAACGKHFPGHGDTLADSHQDLPVVEHPAERLQAVEYEPFRAAIGAGVCGMITAHVLVPALDEAWPATLSARIIQGELRGRLGFGGLVFTDDMEMKALSARWTVPEAAVQAVAAGCDGVLVCSGNHDLHAATLEALVHAVESERLPLARVEDALARQRDARVRFATRSAAPADSGPAVIGCESHLAVAAEMAQHA